METKNSDSLHEKIKKQKEKICGNSPNLSKEAADYLEAALGRLHSLTFKDSKQKDTFFENVQCLQGYHIIEIFNTWVASHLQDSLKDPSKSTREIMGIFEICSQFCYSSDMSSGVSFEVFIRTIKFCFPSDSKKCHLSTRIVVMLLELVQILQEGKLIFPVSDSQKKTYCINSATNLFNDFIVILEARDYCAEDIVDIISQASKFARADIKRKSSELQSELMKTLFPGLQ
ncbi:uncharacterized protein LOC111345251 [Stylophora pistillata]|uniref:uncharacterized protein LOC111345251 n=1 Tax=Stylophora pistillata TaxID=50429 RepID=UPI000C03DB54|nr:uncharacterized protein LOC111345251 [Stylophora pistillata]XP_022808263.1 uncharacterized protein LOC111345251 [Stylophora pistillata]